MWYCDIRKAHLVFLPSFRHRTSEPFEFLGDRKSEKIPLLFFFFFFNVLDLNFWHLDSLVTACGLLLAMCGIQFPDQVLNPGPPCTGSTVLATGPPVPVILNKLLEIYRVYADEITLGGLLGSFRLGAGYQRNQPCRWRAETFSPTLWPLKKEGLEIELTNNDQWFSQPCL